MTRLALVALMLAACGNKNAAPSVKITDADLQAVNAAVPADLKGKIEFEIGTVSDGKGKNPDTYKLVRPKGWKEGFMPGSLKPADADNFDSPTLGKTELRIGSNCDGACEEKDWAAVSDKVHFANLAKQDGRVVKDVKGKHERLMVFEHEPSEHFPEKDTAITILRAWWVDGGTRYFLCEAELGTPVKGLAEAFEKACAKVSGD